MVLPPTLPGEDGDRGNASSTALYTEALRVTPSQLWFFCVLSPDNERRAPGAVGQEERLRPPHLPTLGRPGCSSELPVTPR